MVWCVLNESKCEIMETLISQDDDDDDDDIDFSKMIMTNRVQGLLRSIEIPVWEDSIIGLEIYIIQYVLIFYIYIQ